MRKRNIHYDTSIIGLTLDWVRQLKEQEQLRRNSGSQPHLLRENIWSSAHHNHIVSHHKHRSKWPHRLCDTFQPVLSTDNDTTRILRHWHTPTTNSCSQKNYAVIRYTFIEGDLRELQETCQDHMEIKHQLQGNYENYLIGYLHSKADGSKVLWLPLCLSLIVNRYSPEVFWLLNTLNCRLR